MQTKSERTKKLLIESLLEKGFGENNINRIEDLADNRLKLKKERKINNSNELIVGKFNFKDNACYFSIRTKLSPRVESFIEIQKIKLNERGSINLILRFADIFNSLKKEEIDILYKLTQKHLK